MPPTPSTVSFTVRRPTPVSRPSSSGPESDGPFKVPALPRHLASAGSSATGSPLTGSPRTFSSRRDSDDDGDTGIVFSKTSGADDDTRQTDSSDEESFDLGGQRSGQKKRKGSDSNALLVIPTQPNPDWREAARRRRAACSRVQSHVSRVTPSFVPDSALAATGADGSVGGLGTRDTINSGPQLRGLQINKSVKVEAEEDDAAMVEAVPAGPVDQSTAEETEDQRALRAILAGEGEPTPTVDIIPVPPLSEADALKQDVQDLPDVATANDYERVPISAFGAAMLRGMGWTDEAVTSKLDRKRKNGLSRLYLPQARPALLGIGAKEREPEDDGSGKKKSKGADMRYIPIAKKESGRDENGSSRSGTLSRYSSRSPTRRGERGHDGESRQRTRYSDERVSERKDHASRDRDRDTERDRGQGRSDPNRDRGREGKGKRYDQRDRAMERDRRDRRDNQ